jgi:hypothetical protein
MSDRGRSCQIDPPGGAGAGAGAGTGAAVTGGVVVMELVVGPVVVVVVDGNVVDGNVVDGNVVVVEVDVDLVVEVLNVVVVELAVVVAGIAVVVELVVEIVAEIVAGGVDVVSAKDVGADSAADEQAPSSNVTASQRRLHATCGVCHRGLVRRARLRRLPRHGVRSDTVRGRMTRWDGRYGSPGDSSVRSSAITPVATSSNG